LETIPSINSPSYSLIILRNYKICTWTNGYVGKGILLTNEGHKEYYTQQLKAENFIERNSSEFSDEYNMGITMGFGPTGNFGHFGVAPGLFSVMYFNKDLKTDIILLIQMEMVPKLVNYHKLVNDLLDSYSEKLSKLSKKENQHSDPDTPG